MPMGLLGDDDTVHTNIEYLRDPDPNGACVHPCRHGKYRSASEML